jgi:O-acetyl-ADP-ribose deacetylase (regulator of RNase III)
MSHSTIDSTVVAMLVNQGQVQGQMQGYAGSHRVPPPIVIGSRPEPRKSTRAGSELGLELALADITRDPSDAIVNPVGPGLVDLAVRTAAGPFMLEDFHHGVLALPGAKLTAGNVVVTRGYGLFAGHVIHCCPPVYADDPAVARKTLVACYVEALWVARARGFTSIAFPAIGTGIFRYPHKEAAAVAVRAVVNDLRAYPASPLVRFLFQDEALLRLYASAASGLLGEDPRRGERGIRFAL